MAAPTSVGLQRVTFLAKNTVTANRLVKLNTTADEVLHTTAITEVVTGVAQNTSATGLPVEVEVGSGAIVKLVASGGITRGDPLMPAAADGGKVSTLAGATAVCCGEALQTAVDGATFTAIFRPGVRTPAVT